MLAAENVNEGRQLYMCKPVISAIWIDVNMETGYEDFVKFNVYFRRKEKGRSWQARRRLRD